MRTSGQILIQALVLSALAVVFIGVLVNLATFNIQSANRSYNSESAFQIAEAGIEYYRWHLAHAPQDFWDGTCDPAPCDPGPYVHDFTDKDGAVIGQFSLEITEPPTGSTLVAVLSTGRVNADPTAIRKIKTKLGIPSFAKYATAANEKMRFGAGTVVSGPIHSNDGIRFDGIANNIVTSAQASYDDPDHSGGNEFGVHTHAAPTDPLPPAAVPNRTDVFRAGRQFPVPAIDFVGITATLAQMKADAQTANGRYFASSGVLGYEIVLKANDTFDIHKVSSLVTPPSGCSQSSTGWGTWSINATTTYLVNQPFPANGIIFVEDKLWVSGAVNTARLTIASGRFPESPSTDTDIVITSDIAYTNYDGGDVLALIAQRNINVGLRSDNDLRIDAALIAKNGRVGRFYYPSACGTGYKRNFITLYGTITTNQRYGFSWICGSTYCSGYATRTITYDTNLLYGPPPSFPLTSDQYQTISWEEVK